METIKSVLCKPRKWLIHMNRLDSNRLQNLAGR